MRIFFLFLSVLFLLSCQKTSKQTKNNIRGVEKPLVVNLSNVSNELCNGNVRREFEELNNRYIQFSGEVKGVSMSYFYIDIGYDVVKVSADEQTLVSLELQKNYWFSGVFRFDTIQESYCTFDRNSFLRPIIDGIRITDASILVDMQPKNQTN